MDVVKILGDSFLFRGIDESVLEKLLSENPPALVSYKRGELIYSSSDQRQMVGFVASGRCEVRIDKADGSKTLLNTLSESDSFGVLSVYSRDDFPTQIFAAVNCSVILFDGDQIRHFVNNYSQISANMIDFLVERINFLNRKIATMSAGTVEEKLSSLLLSERKKYGGNSFRFNRVKAAERIGSGRASVYRAISALENEGLISIDEKMITIIDPLGLERKIK